MGVLAQIDSYDWLNFQFGVEGRLVCSIEHTVDLPSFGVIREHTYMDHNSPLYLISGFGLGTNGDLSSHLELPFDNAVNLYL